MLLTDKAKNDFLVWLYSEYDFTEKTFNELYPENLKEWFIIQWFDSFGFNVDIHLVGWSKINFTFNIYFPKNPLDNHCCYVMYDTRTEAIKQAIIKANELYNKRNNNQD